MDCRKFHSFSILIVQMCPLFKNGEILLSIHSTPRHAMLTSLHKSTIKLIDSVKNELNVSDIVQNGAEIDKPDSLSILGELGRNLTLKWWLKMLFEKPSKPNLPNLLSVHC